MESLHIDSMTWDETASASGITPGEIHSRCSNNSHVVGRWVYNTSELASTSDMLDVLLPSLYSLTTIDARHNCQELLLLRMV